MLPVHLRRWTIIIRPVVELLRHEAQAWVDSRVSEELYSMTSPALPSESWVGRIHSFVIEILEHQRTVMTSRRVVRHDQGIAKVDCGVGPGGRNVEMPTGSLRKHELAMGMKPGILAGMTKISY